MVIRSCLLFLAFLLPNLVAHAAETSKVRTGSFVLLAEAQLPDADGLRSRLEQRLKGRLKIDAMEADGKTVILLRVRNGTVLVGLIDSPLPREEADALCASAWYWRTACEATAQHKAQVFVSVVDTDLDTLDANLLQTDVVASLMDGNAIAIASYWGASLQSREAFLRMGAEASREDPPVLLWVGFRMTSSVDKGFSVSTHGMEALGLREIEARDVNRPGGEVFTLMAGMAQYLVSKGPVIKDGDTIGASPDLDIRVTQGPSYWREGLTVYRVVFPAAQ